MCLEPQNDTKKQKDDVGKGHKSPFKYSSEIITSSPIKPEKLFAYSPEKDSSLSKSSQIITCPQPSFSKISGGKIPV